MKKLIFAGFAVLLAFALITCDAITPNENVVEGDDFDWEMSADGGSFTLYLDGSAPVKNVSRALTKPLAQTASNFYEVVFYHNTAATPATAQVARASWRDGEKANVSNVPRGVTYAAAGPASGAVGAGSYAVLFVGRDDGTLLGIGLLSTAAVAAGGTTPGGLVSPSTTSVTFEVVALEAALRLQTAAQDTAGVGVAGDTFLTDAGAAGTVSAANTRLKTATSGTYQFPVYLIPTPDPDAATPTTLATLATFELGPTTGATAITSRLLGVMVKEVATATSQQARIFIPPVFSIPGGTKEMSAGTAEETTAITTGQTADRALVNPIPMTITTVNYNGYPSKKGGLCALTFSIPVYAITDIAVGGVDTQTWYIKPGFGTSQFIIDDGNKGRGGSILLAVGTADYNNITVKNGWN